MAEFAQVLNCRIPSRRPHSEALLPFHINPPADAPVAPSGIAVVRMQKT
jgi:hypothetical protein